VVIKFNYEPSILSPARLKTKAAQSSLLSLIQSQYWLIAAALWHYSKTLTQTAKPLS